MNVYFISGLGADERVFQSLQLPPGFSRIYIPWIEPIDKETLQAYAKRISAAIDTTQPFVIAGLSMGGMIAVEISKRLKPEKTILISSVPLSEQMRPLFHISHRFGFAGVFPVPILKNASILKKVFGKHTRQNRQLLIDVIRDSDPQFLKWAMPAVAGWKNSVLPANFYHIHGTSDHVFPISRTNPTHSIKKGGHFMIVDRASEISAVFSKILVS